LTAFLQSLPMLLAMGAAGMLHCAGMCGGLAALAGRGVLYHTGRAASYLFLGTLAGALGEAVLRIAPLGAGARVLAVAGGALLLAAGLESLGLVRLPGLAVPARFAAAIAGLVRGGPAGSLVVGFANGLLPCPLVYAFLALAAATGSAVEGAATLLVLAAVSAVPLTFCSLIAGRFRAARHAAGVLMIAMAALTVYRGLSLSGPLCHHLH
jgi:sulfite exporter TauE/SafE